MLRILRHGLQTQYITCRTYKNFGHKRQSIPLITSLWHGFLTFSFIGVAIEWKRISKFFLGEVDLDKNQMKGYQEPQGNITDF